MFTDVEYKIKKRNQILFSRDSDCLHELRMLICEQKHLTLVLWVFECMKDALDILMLEFPQETAFINAYDTSYAWASGKVKMPIAKKAILECHAVAKRIDNACYIALIHAIGQGCSTVHVDTHALGLMFYELTAIVIKNNYINYEYEVLDRITYYIERLKWWENNIDTCEKSQEWAGFIVKPKENKEKLMMNKELYKSNK